MSSLLSRLRWRRWLLVTAATAALLAGATPAWAHNTLTATDPAANSQIGQTPAQIVLTFDQPALAIGTAIVVTGPKGPVQAGRPRLVDNTVTQALQPGAPSGRYIVEWRITSADGHPISGTFAFTSTAAGDGNPSQPSSPTPSTPSPRPLLAVPVVAAFVGIAVIAVVATALRRRRHTGRTSTSVTTDSPDPTADNPRTDL